MILLMAMLVIINYYKWFFLKESTRSPHYAKLQYQLNPLIQKTLQAQPLLEIIYVSFISNN